MKAIKTEEENYVELPNYYSFKNDFGIDMKDEILMSNFRKINREVDLVINEVMKNLNKAS
uniref:hypothetical protein n=1 Tax=Ornithobacterium rhinotracheale TaxID=28251 RepID=UPI0039A6E8DC